MQTQQWPKWWLWVLCTLFTFMVLAPFLVAILKEW